MRPEDFNPDLDEPLTRDEQEQIANLSAHQLEETIEQGLMPLDSEDDGYDAAQGIFRPEHPRWRTFIEGRTIAWRSRLTERHLKPVHEETDIKVLQNAYILDPEPYVKETITKSTLCWYPENHVMLLYLKNHIPLRARRQAKSGLDKMVFDDPIRAETQNATMFNARVGTPITLAGELLFGFIDRGWITMTTPTREQASQYEQLKPLMRRLNSLFSRTLPKEYAEQNRLIPAEFRQFGTAFSNSTILKSCPSAIHRDAGNAKNTDLSFTCLTTVGTEGEYSGGELCLIEYGVKIPVKPGDVLIAATAREWHCNLTPVKGTKYSIVCYYRRGLGSPARLQEWYERE
jgi:Oxygenase domain of the 2OGFeDO superfamily